MTKDKYLKTDASTGELIWADGASVDLTGYMTLSTIQSVSGKKTFNPSMLGVKGTGSGATLFTTGNATGIDNTLILPSTNGTLALTSDITNSSLGGEVTGTLGSAFISSGVIDDDNVKSDAGIAGIKDQS